MVGEDDTMRAATPRRDGPENRAMDLWLRVEFTARYGSVLIEPIPSEFLAMLSELR